MSTNVTLILRIASPVNKYTEANITIEAIKRQDTALATLFFRLSMYCTMVASTCLNEADSYLTLRYDTIRIEPILSTPIWVILVGTKCTVG